MFNYFKTKNNMFRTSIALNNEKITMKEIPICSKIIENAVAKDKNGTME